MKNLKAYIQTLKEENNLDINDYFLEKDYMLSLFLSVWAQEETPALNQLIFKGGTLLTKNYLQYHRISEDLDFTHQDANTIRELAPKQQEKEIKKRITQIIEDVNTISKKAGFKFETDRTNETYIELRNSRKLYILKPHYKSIYTGIESHIKIEIAFTEDIINQPTKQTIKTILNYHQINETTKKILNYNLQEPELQTYTIQEITLEKIRACITRIQFKPRDVYDLYLIHQEHNILQTDQEQIIKKIKANPFQEEDINNNIKKFLKEITKINYEEIEELALKPINKEDFEKFWEQLEKKLKTIAKKHLTNTTQ